MKKNKDVIRSINWKLWLGLLISALFLYLAFRNVDLERTWEVIRSAQLLPLSFVVILTFLQYVIRAWRWRILLEPIKKTGFSNRLSSILIGFAANCVLPARLGEFIRANHMGRTENISGSSTFGTIVVERLFDGFTLLLILLIGLLGTSFPREWRSISGSLRATGFFLLFFYILVIVFLAGFKYKAKPFLNILDGLLFFLPNRFRSKITDMIWNFSLGLVLIKNPYQWVQAIFYSLFVWFANLYQIQLIEQSTGSELPFVATFLIMAMASFGAMIPSAPGFIGTFHLSVQYGFRLYGVGKEEALSAAILWHAVLIFPTMLFGLIAFLLFNTSLGRRSEDADVLKDHT